MTNKFTVWPVCIDTKPNFVGGENKLNEYIQRNYKIPSGCPKGKVFITFVVEKDGSLSDLKILMDLGYGTGEEAIRVLKNCPKWNPGLQNQKPVRVLNPLAITINGTNTTIF